MNILERARKKNISTDAQRSAIGVDPSPEGKILSKSLPCNDLVGDTSNFHLSPSKSEHENIFSNAKKHREKILAQKKSEIESLQEIFPVENFSEPEKKHDEKFLDEKISSEKNSDEKISVAKNFECKKCGSVFRWVPRSHTELYCLHCDPPPTKRFARAILTLAESAPGRWGWGATTPISESDARHLAGVIGEPIQPEGESAATTSATSRSERTAINLTGGTCCRKCRGTRGVATPIHGGKAERIDCEQCGAFIDFGRWDGHYN